ncbi:MAG: 1-acyl-sn-glycerol-3-phosphate acyltransferase [Gemmatimonadetes bacterium]|nr:1-acyl-sn-glycerol-3-phosphate acyltransferase [Gemmatimonadota bacterium]
MEQDHISVIIFPEGTRSTTSELLPFKDGAFRLAIDARCPFSPRWSAAPAPPSPSTAGGSGSPRRRSGSSSPSRRPA